MKTFICICSFILVASSLPAFADNFRCPNGNIVSTGDRISTVSAKCDPPDATFRREEPVETSGGRHGSRAVYIEVQEWTYTKSSTLLHTLIFRNGILSEVITGGFTR